MELNRRTCSIRKVIFDISTVTGHWHGSECALTEKELSGRKEISTYLGVNVCFHNVCGTVLMNIKLIPGMFDQLFGASGLSSK